MATRPETVHKQCTRQFLDQDRVQEVAIREREKPIKSASTSKQPPATPAMQNSQATLPTPCKRASHERNINPETNTFTINTY